MDSSQIVLSKGVVIVTRNDNRRGATKVNINLKENTLATPTPAEFDTALQFRTRGPLWHLAHAPPGEPYYLPPETPGSSSSLGQGVAGRESRTRRRRGGDPAGG
jgi:hypothetical protein